MHFQSIIKNDLCNGEGVRVTLFVSGCTHNCKGCYNPKGQNFKFGEKFAYKHLWEICEELDKPHVTGLTLTGGDPFMSQHGDIPAQVALEAVKRKKNVWAWTGYSKEEIKDHPLTNYCDVIVCGKYDESKPVAGRFYGSDNQYLWYPKTGEVTK